MTNKSINTARDVHKIYSRFNLSPFTQRQQQIMFHFLFNLIRMKKKIEKKKWPRDEDVDVGQ